MSDEIVTAMITACGVSIFLFELYKKNYKACVVLLMKWTQAPGKHGF